MKASILSYLSLRNTCIDRRADRRGVPWFWAREDPTNNAQHAFEWLPQPRGAPGWCGAEWRATHPLLFPPPCLPALNSPASNFTQSLCPFQLAPPGSRGAFLFSPPQPIVWCNGFADLTAELTQTRFKLGFPE